LIIYKKHPYSLSTAPIEESYEGDDYWRLFFRIILGEEPENIALLL